MKYLLFIFFISAFSAHEYYSSITNVKYSEKDKCFIIDIELDAKDLETTLNKYFDTVCNLGEENELEMADDLLLTYIKDNLSLQIKNQKLDLELVNKQIDWSHAYIFLKSNFSKKRFNQLKIENSLLTDCFADQRNIVQISIKEVQFSELLNNNKTSFEKNW